MCRSKGNKIKKIKEESQSFYCGAPFLNKLDIKKKGISVQKRETLTMQSVDENMVSGKRGPATLIQ